MALSSEIIYISLLQSMAWIFLTLPTKHHVYPIWNVFAEPWSALERCTDALLISQNMGWEMVWGMSMYEMKSREMGNIPLSSHNISHINVTSAVQFFHTEPSGRLSFASQDFNTICFPASSSNFQSRIAQVTWKAANGLPTPVCHSTSSPCDALRLCGSHWFHFLAGRSITNDVSARKKGLFNTKIYKSKCFRTICFLFCLCADSWLSIRFFFPKEVIARVTSAGTETFFSVTSFYLSQYII